MMRSRAYTEVREQAVAELHDPGWPAAARWLARVGGPRVAAEAAAQRATSLLKDISINTHRDDPELKALLRQARAAASAYASAVARSNWARFKGEEPMVETKADTALDEADGRS